MKAPVYDFDLDNLPVADWVGMSEGERLFGGQRGIPRPTLYAWTNVGCRVSWLPTGSRFVLPSFTQNGRRYTTVAAFKWWLRHQQEPPR